MSSFFTRIKAFFMAIFVPILMLFGWTGGIEVPESKADILNLYKTAIEDFNTGKPAFERSLSTNVTTSFKIAGVPSDSTAKDFKEFLYDGQTIVERKSSGDDNTTLLFLKELTEAEIDSAECELSDDLQYFNIKIVLINEISKGKALDSLSKITDCYYDTSEIKTFMDSKNYAATKTELKLSNIVINATVSVEDSRFTSLSISFTSDAVFDIFTKDKIIHYTDASYQATTNIKYSKISDWTK